MPVLFLTGVHDLFTSAWYLKKYDTMVLLTMAKLFLYKIQCSINPLVFKNSYQKLFQHGILKIPSLNKNHMTQETVSLKLVADIMIIIFTVFHCDQSIYSHR
jgi:hypothetical protein